MQKLTSSEIKQKIENGETFLLDFYAVWCGPCKMMMRTLEDHESDLGVQVYTFDVDTDQKFTQEHSVRGVPTLKYFENGEIKRTKSGVMGLPQLREFVS
jgi:thiol-disulfide isomerase/thioredoxin